MTPRSSGPPVFAAAERCPDISLMFDEPLDVASIRRMGGSVLGLAVAQGPPYGPLVDVVRVCVRWSLRAVVRIWAS